MTQQQTWAEHLSLSVLSHPARLGFALRWQDGAGLNCTSAATASTAFNGHSQTVLAQEQGGSIATNAQGILSVTPGVYTGALDITALSTSLALNLSATGLAGGSLQTDGLSTGYFTETQYDALNHKIASNEGDGLWRTFGVDGNGNTVQTNLLGDRNDPAYNPANAITTYAAFDARNRKVADFGALIMQAKLDPQYIVSTRATESCAVHYERLRKGC